MTDKRTVASNSVRERPTFLAWLLALALLTLPSTPASGVAGNPLSSPSSERGDGWSTGPPTRWASSPIGWPP